MRRTGKQEGTCSEAGTKEEQTNMITVRGKADVRAETCNSLDEVVVHIQLEEVRHVVVRLQAGQQPHDEVTVFIVIHT
jgi:hypothetical protein